jgi:imidazolonepropionase-like amidohydrolase
LAVARAAGTNAVAIKIYANLPAVLVQAITAEAHRQGLLVWAHGMVFPATPAEVIQAGVDSVSHVNYLAYQASERRPTSYQGKFPIEQAAVAGGDNAVLAGLFEQMRQRGTVLDATNRLYAGADAELGAALTRQAFQAGVDICTGTDGFSADEDPFPALYDELRILHENVGMPAEQVIRSATLVGAMSLGQVHTMGTIEPGKLANFAVLAENPLLDMGNLRSITCTVKRGRRYERTEYATC